MNDKPAPETAPIRGHDVFAVLTIVLVAALALASSGFMPWWTMTARAPQYGQRALIIEVSPRRVSGDVFEMDALGHYVGIRSLEKLAPIERKLAPLGLAAALAGLLVAPFLRRKLLRALAVLPLVAMPVVFMLDLQHWMLLSTNERDPNASLNLTISRIDTKLIGKYEIGQFKVEAQSGGGLYIAGVAGLLGLGLVFVSPVPFPLRRRRRAAAATAAAGAMLTCLWPAAGECAEHLVREGQSIAAAVATAADGDTVALEGAVFRERLVLDKRIRLVGRPGAVIDGGGEGTVVHVRAAGVELSGLTLRNSGTVYRTEDAGVRIEKAADVTIRESRIEDTLFGIFAVEADRCTIDGTTVIGKDLPHERRGDGIRLWYSHGCVLRGNHVDRSRDVIIWYSAETIAEENHVRNSRYGLHYMYSDRNVFRRNRFEDNQVGAAIMYSHGVELSENSFSFSNGVSAYGLLVKDADDVFVVGNRFVGNATALFFDGAPQSRGGRVTIHKNLIARNDVGLALQPLCRGIEIWENAFIGNRTQVQILGEGTGDANTWTVGGRGNHWSDAVVYDRDGDGVSEIPYRAESTYEALEARFPALAFFSGTPGAEAIDGASRLFPLFATRPRLTDTRPLAKPHLDAWAGGDPEPGSSAIAAAGGAMIAVAALTLALGRRALA